MMAQYKPYYLDILLILLILIVGAAMLFYKIGQVPPLYPWSDESEIAADAVASLNSGLQLIYPIQRSGGAMGVWLETGWMALFGRDLLGLRLLNGLVNLTAALLLYLVVRELPFHPPGLDRRWLAATAALLFAVSTWLLGLGRIAAPNWSLVSPLTSLAFYWFWRGLQTERQGYFIAAGVVMGLMIYGYLPGYLIIGVPTGFLALAWLLNLEQRRFFKPPRSLLIYPAALVAAAPALVWIISNPILVLNRPMQVVHNSELAEESSLLQGNLDMLSTFGLLPNWLFQGNFENLAFDPLVTALFVAGLLIALWHWRKPAYLFLLVWWAVLIAPAWLSQSASDGFIFEVWRRGVGAQPVSFIFPALAIVHAATWLHRCRPSLNSRLLLAPSIALVVIVSAGFSYWLYFKQWANSDLIPFLFAETPVRMVEWMEQTGGPETLYLLPMRPNVSYTTRPELFTTRYLYDGPAKMAIPVMDEAIIDKTLRDLLADRPAEIRLMLPDRILIDPKGYFEYALGAVGAQQSREQDFGFTITAYQVNTPTALDSSLEATSVNFGDTLELVGTHLVTRQPVAGQSLSVALRWAKRSDTPVDYSASLILADAQGYDIARSDKPLLSEGDYLTSQHWRPGAESTLYYSLLLPPDTPPGRYTLRLMAYDTATGNLLPPVGGQTDLSLRLPDIEVQPNPTPVDPVTLTMAQPLESQFPNGLRLLGVDSSAAATQQPGDRLRVTLLWQALQPLTQDAGLILALAGDDPIPLLAEPQPLIPDYPTTNWLTGQVYRANYTTLLPATLETGDYQLALRLVDLATGDSLGEQLLGSLSVRARDHRFDAPPLAQPVEADFATPAGETVIRLLGYDIPQASLSPTQPIEVKLQWQAMQTMPAAYKVFLHLIDGAGRIVSQVDTLPQQGAALTTSWLPGEIIEDTLLLSLPSEGVSGNYRLIVGLYDQYTGERLLTEQGDQVTLINEIVIP